MFASRPRVLKHTENKSDISFVPNTAGTQAEKLYCSKEQGNRWQLGRIFLQSGISRCSWYLMLLIKNRCKCLSAHFVLVKPSLRRARQSKLCYYWKLMCWKSLLKSIFWVFQMEIDTALSDLEAADFAELVNVIFVCIASISLVSHPVV